MTYKERMQMIEDNVEQNRERYEKGEITDAQWERTNEDAERRLSELRREGK